MSDPHRVERRASKIRREFVHELSVCAGADRPASGALGGVARVDEDVTAIRKLHERGDSEPHRPPAHLSTRS